MLSEPPENLPDNFVMAGEVGMCDEDIIEVDYVGAPSIGVLIGQKGGSCC
jgi:hypothetical protein